MSSPTTTLSAKADGTEDNSKTTDVAPAIDVERVFLRLVNVSDATGLQRFVDNWLVQTVRQLGAQAANQAENAKIMELLTHLNKRLRAEDTIVLPVGALVSLAQSCSANAVVMSISLVYIKMGFGRLGRAEQVRLLPDLLRNLNQWPQQQRNTILQTMSAALLSLAALDKKEWPDLSTISTNDDIRHELLEFLTDILLLPFNSTPDQQQTPVGMSAAGFARVQPLTDLDTLKFNCVKFVSKARGWLLADDEIICLIIIALADTSHTVNNAADVEIKKLDLPDLLERPAVVAHLYALYVGQMTDKQIPEANRRQPVSVRHKVSLMPYIARSRRAAGIFPKNMQVVVDALLGAHANAKLHAYAIELIPAVIQVCPDAHTGTFVPILFSSLRKLLAQTKDPRTLARAYLALGKAGTRHPPLVTHDIALVQQLFEAVQSASDDESSSCADCLTSWIEILCASEQPSMKHLVSALTIDYLTRGVSRAALLSLKFGERLFESSDAAAMWLLCAAAASHDDTRRAEAQRILVLFCKNADKLPSVERAVDYFHSKAFASDKNSTDSGPPSGKRAATDTKLPVVVKPSRKSKTSKTTSKCILHLQPAVAYLRHVLLCATGTAADADQVVNQDFVLDTDGLLPDVTVDYAGPSLRQLPDQVQPAVLQKYTECVRAGAANMDGCYGLQLLYECAVHWPQATLAALNHNTQWILDKCVHSSQRATASAAVKLYAQLWHHANPKCTGKALTERLADVDKLQGPNVVLVVSWLMALSPQGIAAADLLDRELTLYNNINLQQVNVTQLELACAALAQFYRYRSSGLSATDLTAKLKDTLGEVAITHKAAVPDKCRLAALHALALVQPAVPTDEFANSIVDLLVQVADGPPRLELQLYVGSALLGTCMRDACVLRRDLHKCSYDQWITTHVPSDDCKTRVAALVNRICTEYLTSTNRHIKRASIIWLFVIVKSCAAQLSLLSQNIDQVQKAFLTGISEPNDLTQELASQGLGLLYESGSEAEKRQMMDTLVDSLTGTANPAVSKPAGGTADMEVAPINLNSASAGDAPSTYKEMYNLAADMNKPELVYKFMQLANNQAMWNSKVGAAFGVSRVLSQASEQLQPHLHVLIPKLYRYRYDPDVKVASSMRSIWKLLVGQNKDVVEKHNLAIYDDIAKGLESPQWRIRESCCLALSDLLTSPGCECLYPRLAATWRLVFRVQDDMKESVRLAADKAANTLANVTIRLGESNRVESEHFGESLNVLIEHGLTNKVDAVKRVTLKCVIALCKQAGVQLRPHLLVIVPSLLEAMSDLEPAVLNYLAARSQGQSAEQLDSARAAAARSSPLMDALSDCVRLLDEPTIKLLAPVLAKLLKVSVGLPTRAAVCSMLNAICASCARELRAAPAVAGQLIQALTTGLSDRNVYIRKQYASSIGRLAKFANSSQLNKVVLKIINAYVAQADEMTETALLYGLHGIAHNSPETLVDLGTTVAPITLMMHLHYKDLPTVVEREQHEKAIKMWHYIWNELVSTTESGVRLYRTEIVSFCGQLLSDCGWWRLKADAALALGQVAVHCTRGLQEGDDIGVLCGLLFSALDGSAWQGKQHLLQALGHVFTELRPVAASTSDAPPPLPEQNLEKWRLVLLRETKKRKSVEYKTAALECVCAFELLFTAATDYQQRATALIDIVQPLLEKPAGLYDSDDEADEQSAAERTARAAHTAAFELAAVAVVQQLCTAQPNNLVLRARCLDIYSSVLRRSTDWRCQQAVADALAAVLRQSITVTANAQSYDLSHLLRLLADLQERSKQQSLQLSLSRCVLALLAASQQTDSALQLSDVGGDVIDQLGPLLSSETLAVDEQQLNSARRCVDQLKLRINNQPKTE